MRSLQPINLLDIWDRGQNQAPVHRALMLLEAAFPDDSYEELIKLSIGQRNKKLLSLRKRLFGSEITGLVNCADCNEKVEVNFLVDDIISSVSLTNISENQKLESNHLTLHADGYDIQYRLPNGEDLSSLTEASSSSEIRFQLIQRFILSATTDNDEIPIDELPIEVLDALEGKMAEIDPLVNIEPTVVCPDCGHKWPAAFDILEFIWSEIDNWAQHMLSEIHVLASAYGWSEREILAMSPMRRSVYINKIYG